MVPTDLGIKTISVHESLQRKDHSVFGDCEILQPLIEADETIAAGTASYAHATMPYDRQS